MNRCSAHESNCAQYPLVKIFTLGAFALERLISLPSSRADDAARYMPIAPYEWNSRGPALTLLKVLLCRPNRRAARDQLIEAIWPRGGTLNAMHALDSAASVLRRHILRTPCGGSLLLTMRSRGETIFRLPGQCCLWVDADELLELAARAVRAQCQRRDLQALLEGAHALCRGEFLEDDPYAEWAQGRRRTVEGARRRVLYRLVDVYLRGAHAGRAEELLFAELEQNPLDEDMLCRLMILLVEQGRRQEALQIYQYTADVLHEERSEPALYTRELATRVRQGLTLREGAASYTIAGSRSSRLAWRTTRPALTIVSAAMPGTQATTSKPIKASSS